MAEMGEMEMPMPDNTLPMMTGFGQFGPIEMGGMFTVVKVREGLAADDYKDPGWYKHPRRHGRLRDRQPRGDGAAANRSRAIDHLRHRDQSRQAHRTTTKDTERS